MSVALIEDLTLHVYESLWYVNNLRHLGVNNYLEDIRLCVAVGENVSISVTCIQNNTNILKPIAKLLITVDVTALYICPILCTYHSIKILLSSSVKCLSWHGRVIYQQVYFSLIDYLPLLIWLIPPTQNIPLTTAMQCSPKDSLGFKIAHQYLYCEDPWC